jgi:hypothetical protein
VFSSEKKWLVDVGRLALNDHGDTSLPRSKKLGIRGYYVFAAAGLSASCPPEWVDTYTARAGCGSTFASFLQGVLRQAPTLELESLCQLAPAILTAVSCAANVDVVEEASCLNQESRDGRQFRVEGVAYDFTSQVEQDQFFAWLDITGYGLVDYVDDTLLAHGLHLRTGLSHSGCVLRISVFQSTSNIGLDCICNFGRPLKTGTI